MFFEDYITPSDSSFTLSETHCGVLHRLVSSLRVDKASGLGTIFTRLLKEACPEIVPNSHVKTICTKVNNQVNVISRFRKKEQRSHRIKASVLRSTKHGVLVLRLPETPFITRSLGHEVILLCGDMHPLPGPQENFSLGPVEKPDRITYSTARLTELGKTDRLPAINNTLVLRLQNLGLWNTAFNQNLSPIPVISTRRFKTNSSLRSSRCLRSYNCNNCVVFSPGEYANNQRNNSAMVQCSATIPIRITQRPQAPHGNKYVHVRCYDNFRKGNKAATPRNYIQIKLDDKSTNNSLPKQSSLPSFCLVNARSLFPKLGEVSALLATNVVDFVAITETWLNGDFEDHLLSICGYTFFEETGCTVEGVVFAFVWLKTYLVDVCWTWKTPILNGYGSAYALTGYKDHFQESLCAWFISRQESLQKITEASMNI